eukprot:3624668-Amphidinium_carterae.1
MDDAHALAKIRSLRQGKHTEGYQNQLVQFESSFVRMNRLIIQSSRAGQNYLESNKNPFELAYCLTVYGVACALKCPSLCPLLSTRRQLYIAAAVLDEACRIGTQKLVFLVRSRFS